MANCAQKLTWQLKKDALKKMLDEVPGDYSALEFKMCITKNPTTNVTETKYFMSLIQVDSSSSNCDGIIQSIGREEEVCPVPPDCNNDFPLFKSILSDYYERGKISFTLGPDAFVHAFR